MLETSEKQNTQAPPLDTSLMLSSQDPSDSIPTTDAPATAAIQDSPFCVLSGLSRPLV